MRLRYREKASRRFYAFLGLALFLIVFSIVARYIAPNDPYATDVTNLNQAPSAEYPFGTDDMGRCVFSRVLYGARTSIFSAMTLVVITFFFGTAVGMLCGYYGGAADRIVMRVIDGIMAFPQMILAIAVAGVLGGGMFNAMLALGFAGWTPYARLARSGVMAIKEDDFVKASRLSGAGGFYIMARHLLPNILGSLLTYATVQIGAVMLGFAGLSFLGIGVTLGQAEWGAMINEARGLLSTAPWTVFYPGLALVITVMIFNFLGDAARDTMDERGLSISEKQLRLGEKHE